MIYYKEFRFFCQKLKNCRKRKSAVNNCMPDMNPSGSEKKIIIIEIRRGKCKPNSGCDWWNAALVCWPGRQGGVQAALPHAYPLRPPAHPQDGQKQAPDHPVHSSHTAQELWLLGWMFFILFPQHSNVVPAAQQSNDAS